VRIGIRGGGGPDTLEGAGRTLAILTELDLHEVETINIDQCTVGIQSDHVKMLWQTT
jgi:hypothetical protein